MVKRKNKKDISKNYKKLNIKKNEDFDYKEKNPNFKNTEKKKKSERYKKNSKKEQSERDKKVEEDFNNLKKQLEPFLLEIKEVDEDGNCLFRSISHQLEQDEEKHDFYRKKIIDNIEMNKNFYAPFIIDMTFEDYIKKMRKNGTWGGNLEIQVF
jgi:OTU domain-containing protein 3